MIRLRVKEIAVQRGISQGRLSRMSNIDLTTIRRIYNNPTTANITLLTLDKLAKALGVQPSDLIEYVPDEQ